MNTDKIVREINGGFDELEKGVTETPELKTLTKKVNHYMLLLALDYQGKKQKSWYVAKLFSWCLLGVLMLPPFLVWNNYFAEAFACYVLAAGIYGSKKINKPMEKFLQHSAVSIEIMKLINEQQKLTNQLDAICASKEEYIEGFAVARKKWLNLAKNNALVQ